VIEIMRRRTEDPSVYEQDGEVWVKIGDWHRKLRPNHTNVEEKLARMDACGISTTMLSINDPGPEWFGDQGPEVARVIHDYLRNVYMNIVSPLPESMRFAIDFSGTDRLLFSSDHPWVG
jgi:predicted N-formylglutamate amidohydrolase